VFRTIGGRLSPWELLLPAELLRVPEEPARVDALLDDPAFFDRPVEFGYKAQVIGNDDGVIVDYAVRRPASPAPRRPARAVGGAARAGARRTRRGRPGRARTAASGPAPRPQPATRLPRPQQAHIRVGADAGQGRCQDIQSVAGQPGRTVRVRPRGQAPAQSLRLVRNIDRVMTCLKQAPANNTGLSTLGADGAMATCIGGCRRLV
jgi:hypothetical protein